LDLIGSIGQMAEAAQASSSVASRQESIPLSVFSCSVFAPAVEALRRWVNLMPLGHWIPAFRDSPPPLAGIGCSCFSPWGLLDGVNDIVDAETCSLNPAQRHVHVLVAGRVANKLWPLKWQIAVLQIPFVISFLFLGRGAHFVVYAVTSLAVGILQCARHRVGKDRLPWTWLYSSAFSCRSFVLSSWLNNTQQLPGRPSCLRDVLRMHSHIFGEVMDI